MSTHNLVDDKIKRSLKRREERLFQAIFMLSFPVFFILVLATRLLPAAGESKKESILSEAKASARSTIAVALTD
jgi:hypothetical protein